jgi:ferrochelatase
MVGERPPTSRAATRRAEGMLNPTQPSAATRSVDPSRLPADHPDVRVGRIGVLLLNLGTPDATDYWSVRRYLKEFLSDRRVIEVSRPVWWVILNLFVLTTRPQRSGRAYASIWNRDRNESPLKTTTRSQSERLAAMLGDDDRILVDWAMRYGNPSTASRLTAMMDAGCDRILLVPLYPQYSASTTASANDAAFAAMARMRWQPAVRTLPPYYDHPAHIEAIARSLTDGLAALDFEPQKVLASFHGMPVDYLLKGDPYHCQCQKTARLVREQLGWPEERLTVTFQSRFGRAEWLKPYTDETVKQLARDGLKRLAVITPGFAADCLETVEEIAIQNAGFFHAEGGEKFAAIPCLNDSDTGMAMLEELVRTELKGWI